MLILNSKETVKKILGKIGCYKYDKDIELLINGINISILDKLSEKPSKAELGLFKFGNNPVSFISFKEKIKYSLMNGIKIHFNHLPDNKKGIEKGLNIINEIINGGGKIIIQLPINNKEILERINQFNDFEDIDNLKQNEDRYGCTQSAIIGLSNYIIKREGIKNIIIFGSEGFIGKGVKKGLSEIFPDLNIYGIDIHNKCNENELKGLIEKTELIISNSSSIINLPENIINGVSIIDCGFIRGKLGIRGTIPINKEYANKYKIITLVPGGIGPLEMLYLVSKVKNISNDEMNKLINENIVFTEFNI